MTSLKDLTDDQLIDEYHQAKLAHATAAVGEKDDAFARMNAIEREMHLRHGMGVLVKRYQQRFPPVK